MPVQAAARAASGFGPVQTMSALSVKTGPAPSSGSARFRPPPVSRSSGSWETRASGAARARCACICPAWAWVLTTMRGMPAARASASGVVDERPAGDLDEGLRPVAGQRAHAGAEAGGEDHDRPRRHAAAPIRASTARLGRGDVAGDEGGEGGERRVGEVAREVRPDARQVGEVARLAVAAAEAGEEAEDLEVALGGEQAAAAVKVSRSAPVSSR